MRLSPLAGWIAFVLGIALPVAAHAQGLATQGAQGVAGSLQAFFGGGCSGADCALTTVEFAIDRFQLVVIAAGAFALVRNGFTLLYTSSEDDQSKAKKAIATTLAAIMLAFLAPRFIIAFFTAGGEEGVLASEGGAMAGAAIVSDEILGIVRWALSLFAVICLLVVIITGIRALTSPSDGGEKMKSAIISIVAGGLLLICSEAIKAGLGIVDGGIPTGGTPAALISRAVQIVAGILGIITLVAFGVVVYAGILMILAAGNEDQFSKAKSLIIRAGVGLLIILTSYLLASFIVQMLGG